MVGKVITFLSGKKTYIVAGLMVALGLAEGNMDRVMEGLAILGLRLGIAKI